MKASGIFILTAVGLLGGGVWFAWWQAGQESVRSVTDDAPEQAEAQVDVPENQADFQERDPEVAGGPRWTDLNDAGIRALEVDDFEAAIKAFEACLAGDPSEQVYARNLAEALARAAASQHESGNEDERLAAIQLLERAVGLDPSRAKLADLLGRWKRSAAAEEGFYVHRTDHFHISYDLDRNEVRGEIDEVGELLEKAYMTYSEAFQIYPASSGPIRVVLYTREGFDRVTGIGPWAGGVYDGTIRLPVGDLHRELPRVRSVLRHELVHAFVQEKGGSAVPAWLNEGLAQWLESATPGSRASEAARARQRLVGTQPFPLAELRGSLAAWEDTQAIERAYAQALALVGWIASEYQNNGVQSNGVLFEMVAGCGQGQSAESVFEVRIGIPLETVLQDLMQQ